MTDLRPFMQHIGLESLALLSEQELAEISVFADQFLSNPDAFNRSSILHFTSSSWAVNPDRTKSLFVYHNHYYSWSWVGGHADGERDFARVAIKELWEETGIMPARILSQPISLEMLTVPGHIKNGSYVPSHLHMNVTYLFEADDTLPVSVKEDENSAVSWFPTEQIYELSTEPWLVDNVYRKIIGRIPQVNGNSQAEGKWLDCSGLWEGLA